MSNNVNSNSKEKVITLSELDLQKAEQISKASNVPLIEAIKLVEKRKNRLSKNNSEMSSNWMVEVSLV